MKKSELIKQTRAVIEALETREQTTEVRGTIKKGIVFLAFIENLDDEAEATTAKSVETVDRAKKLKKKKNRE